MRDFGSNDRPVSFEAWVDARHGALVRTAYLLTGDPQTALELVQSSLAKLGLRWSRVRGHDDLDADARRLLIHDLRSSRPQPGLVVAGAPRAALIDLHATGLHDVVWELLETLPPLQRAVLVLEFHLDLTGPQAAEALGRSVHAVQSATETAIEALSQRVQQPGIDPVAALVATLAERADQAPEPLPDHPAILARVVELRRSRTRVMVVSAAVLALAAALVVLIQQPGRPPGTPVPTARPYPNGPPFPSPDKIASPSIPAPQEPSGLAWLTSLPPGPTPKIGYAVNRTFVSPDGSRTRLPVSRSTEITSVAPYQSGLLMAFDRHFGGTTQLSLVNADGSTAWARCSGDGPPVTSGDGERTAFYAWQHRNWPPLCSPSTVESTLISRGNTLGSRADEVSSEVPGRGHLIGLVGDQVVFQPDDGGFPQITDLVGEPREIPGLGRATSTDGDRGLVAGTRPGDPYSGIVLDVGSGRLLWQKPGWVPGPFNQSGTRLLASAQPTGGLSAWAVLDAGSGAELVRIGTPPTIQVLDATWENDDTLLLRVTTEHPTSPEAILRVASNGTITRAGDVLTGLSRVVFAAHS